MRTLLSRENTHYLLKVTMTQPSVSVQCAVRTGAAVTIVSGKPKANAPGHAE